MGKIKFKILHKCQNGHPRWLYGTITRDGFKNDVEWGEKHPDCNCSTFNFGEGFSPCKDPELIKD